MLSFHYLVGSGCVAPSALKMVTALALATAPVQGGVVTWDGGAGTFSWIDADNWNPNAVPSAADDVVIDIAGTITVTIPSGMQTITSLDCVENLTISNGTLSVSAASSIDGLLTWSGGTIGGTGTVDALSGITISGAATKTLSGSLVNHAAATWTAGLINILDGGVFTNLPGAVFDAQGNTTITGQSLGFFDNQGTFRRSVQTDVVTVQAIDLDNSGLVEVLTGELSLNTDGTHAGDFTGSPGAIIRFGGGAHLLESTSSVVADAVEFDGGSITIDGSYDAGLTEFAATAVTFNPASTVVSLGDDLVIGSGINTLNSGDLIDLVTYTHTNGTLAGSSDISISGAMTWSGGTIGGTGTVDALSGITISGAATKTLSGSLVNHAAATWTAGLINILDGGVFTNLPGAVFDAQGNTTITGQSLGFFDNQGTFRRSVQTDVVTVQAIDLDNSGLVEVLTGELSLNTDGTHAGDFTGSPGAIIRFGGGTHLLESTSSVVADAVEFDGGSITIDGSYDAGLTEFAATAVTFNPASTILSLGDDLVIGSGINTLNSGDLIDLVTYTHTNGTLAGSSDISISGAMTWSGGTIGGTGTVDALSGITISGAATKTLSGSLVNHAAATWTAGLINILDGGVFTNLPGAVFDAQGNTTITGQSLGFFDNQGTFRRSVQTDAVVVQVIDFANSGTVDVRSGELDLMGTLTNFAGTTLTGGTFIVAGLLQFQNASIVTNAADVTLDGPAGQIQNNANVDALDELTTITGTGAFRLINGRTFNTGSSLSNNGSIALGKDCVLNVNGSYTQGAGATYSVTFGSASIAGALINSVMNVTDTASLDGLAHAVQADQFIPANCDQMDVVIAGTIAGQFSDLDLPPVSSFPVWTINYENDIATLLFADVDINDDNVVGPADLAQLLAEWGTCALGKCNADFNCNGEINPADLATLLANWGSPPR